MRAFVLCCAALAVVSAPRVGAQGDRPVPLSLLDVPFISQSEALCGGAAAAMVLRYWGERGITAETFAPLVDASAAGIRTDALTDELQRRGWTALSVAGSEAILRAELARGRPVITLIEDRPSTFHYVVLLGWHDRGVVLHDPARGPFVVMSRDTFHRRWDAADRWMAVVVPGAPKGAAVTPAPAMSPVTGACREVVAESVRLAQANDLASAERLLASAVACPAAGRELAGIRVMQKRWVEAEDLAEAAIAAGDADRYAWQVLATSRFVQNDRAGALDAWNQAGEPTLDLVRIDGLERTRHRVIEQLIGLTPGALLTHEAVTRARRRLAALPSAAATRLDYVPVPGGLAEIRGFVGEQSIVPRGWLEVAAIGLRAAATREVTFHVASPTGGGEQLWAAWRFWPHRRRVAAGIASPAPWGGTWSLDAASEHQAFASGVRPAARRASAHVGVGQWMTGRLRWTAVAGVDEWNGMAIRPSAAGGLRYVSMDDRATADVTASVWPRSASFGALSGSLAVRSSVARRGTVLAGGSHLAFVSAHAPLDLWPAGDTGHARPMLLRAHPVLEDGRLREDRLGRHFVQGTVEVQHWLPVRAPFNLAGAVFTDVGRTMARPGMAPRSDVDAGVGARLAIAGIPGVFRIDVARGLRDRAHAFSVAYQP